MTPIRPEFAKLKALNNDRSEEVTSLAGKVEDLRGQLAEARRLTPYGLPADVLARLTILLPGWPATGWRELAPLERWTAESRVS